MRRWSLLLATSALKLQLTAICFQVPAATVLAAVSAIRTVPALSVMTKRKAPLLRRTRKKYAFGDCVASISWASRAPLPDQAVLALYQNVMVPALPITVGTDSPVSIAATVEALVFRGTLAARQTRPAAMVCTPPSTVPSAPLPLVSSTCPSVLFQLGCSMRYSTTGRGM